MRRILKLKYIKFNLDWESLQRSPDPLAGFKGPTSKAREGRKDEREGQVRGRREGRDLLLRREGGAGVRGGKYPVIQL